MHQLHSCRVMKRERNKVFLSSISGRYDFEMFEGVDDNQLLNKIKNMKDQASVVMNHIRKISKGIGFIYRVSSQTRSRFAWLFS